MPQCHQASCHKTTLPQSRSATQSQSLKATFNGRKQEGSRAKWEMQASNHNHIINDNLHKKTQQQQQQEHLQCHYAWRPHIHKGADHKAAGPQSNNATKPQSFKVTKSPNRQATKPQSHRDSKPQLPDHKVTTSFCHKSPKLIALMP